MKYLDHPPTNNDWIELVEELRKEITEKDAMIDWLTNVYAGLDCPHRCIFEDVPSLEECKNCWHKAAQDAVKHE